MRLNQNLVCYTIMEVLVKVDVIPGDLPRHMLVEGRERLSPEEFGDRSRDHESMTLVYNLSKGLVHFRRNHRRPFAYEFFSTMEGMTYFMPSVD